MLCINHNAVGLDCTCLYLYVPYSDRAGRTGPADPETALPILTKLPIMTYVKHCHVQSAIFNIYFVPLLFSPPSNSPFLLYAITRVITNILVTTHVIQITRLSGFMAAGVLLWFVTIELQLLAYLACRRLKKRI